jgi:hypothetical protein
MVDNDLGESRALFKSVRMGQRPETLAGVRPRARVVIDGPGIKQRHSLVQNERADPKAGPSDNRQSATAPIAGAGDRG